MQNVIFLRTNSESNPSAQNNKLLRDKSSSRPGISALGEALESNKGVLGIYYYLFCLMQSSGTRIAELLDASHEQITSTGKILIRGKKGSDDRLISDVRSEDFLLKCRSIKRKPFEGCNRFTARRMLQRVSIFTQKEGRTNLTMTGIFRESYAKEIREIENTDSKVSKLLGHKNLKNGRFYGKG